jgi:excisionase family DNA binding protein
MSTSPSHSPTKTSLTGEQKRDEIRRTQGHATQDDRLLTIDEVSVWLGVSKAWVYDHVTRKHPRLPCIRFGELTRFRRKEIERFIEEHAKPDGITST